MKKLMTKLNERKGFTLAELLIVVAIIAVLVAVAIPVFNTQLEKAKEATDAANIRAAYAEVMTAYLDTGSAASKSVTASQKTAGWTSSISWPSGMGTPSNKASGDTWTVSITDAGSVSIN